VQKINQIDFELIKVNYYRGKISEMDSLPASPKAKNVLKNEKALQNLKDTLYKDKDESNDNRGMSLTPCNPEYNPNEYF